MTIKYLYWIFGIILGTYAINYVARKKVMHVTRTTIIGFILSAMPPLNLIHLIILLRKNDLLTSESGESNINRSYENNNLEEKEPKKNRQTLLYLETFPFNFSYILYFIFSLTVWFANVVNNNSHKMFLISSALIALLGIPHIIMAYMRGRSIGQDNLYLFPLFAHLCPALTNALMGSKLDIMNNFALAALLVYVLLPLSCAAYIAFHLTCISLGNKSIIRSISHLDNGKN